jgi:hypothetical protein
MQLNASDIQDLIKLVDYTIQNESTNYEEFVDSGGQPKDHIYWTARRLQDAIQTNQRKETS